MTILFNIKFTFFYCNFIFFRVLKFILSLFLFDKNNFLSIIYYFYVIHLNIDLFEKKFIYNI